MRYLDWAGTAGRALKLVKISSGVTALFAQVASCFTVVGMASAQTALDPSGVVIAPQPDQPAQGALPEPVWPAPVEPQAAAEEAQGEPADEGVPSVDAERVVIDTEVSDVRVGGAFTIATMGRSENSSCPSQEYFIERERPEWLIQTGRLLQAMKEGASVRISFRCVDGYQSINAIQFLTPPNAVTSRQLPRRSQSVEALVRPVPRPPEEALPDGGAAPVIRIPRP